MFADPEDEPPFHSFDILYLIGLALISWAVVIGFGLTAYFLS